MEWICLLMPACVAVGIRYRRLKAMRSLGMPELIFYWAKWVLLINILVMGMITYGLKIEGIVSEAFKSFPFFIKYTAIAVCISLVLPYAIEILEKYIEVSLEIGEKNEKDH